MKNYKVVVILGNFGVGKSTLLSKLHEENGLKEPFFCGIKQTVENTDLTNCFILGKTKEGADSISQQKKVVARLKVVESNRNIFIAGMYYISELDFDYYIKNGLIPIFIKLNTSKSINRQRIKDRSGAKFNEATWATSENKFCKLKEYAIKRDLRFEEIDNDRAEEETFKDFLNILKTIQFEP